MGKGNLQSILQEKMFICWTSEVNVIYTGEPFARFIRLISKNKPARGFRQKPPLAGKQVQYDEILFIAYGCLVFSSTHDSFRANVAVGEIAVAKLTDRNTLGRGRMCKVSVPDVDSDMGNTPASRIEEYQISGTQIALGDSGARSELGIGLAWNGKAKFFVYILRKSGAIEPFVCRSASFIRNTDDIVYSTVKR